jgi:jumonji domain-containing protein 2
MPAYDRDRKVREEAQDFCKTKSTYPQPCPCYTPALDELSNTTFSDFVRKVVLRGAERYEADASFESDDRPPPARQLTQRPPIPYGHGMSKVSLPKGFCDQPIDPTGRGPEWQAGTTLGDMMLPSPMNQCVRGIGGIYEYTFLDLPPISASDFRTKADDYFNSQLGNKTATATDVSIELLERKFWKRLGPTMQPAMYGADMEGSMFDKDDECHGWNISKLNSCLELLLSDYPEDHQGGIPGVTTPYLYFGMWASVFCAHTEDMNLLSINYHHAGAPKVWYAVAAGEDAQRMEQFCEGHYHQAKTGCPEYLRHKRCLISPAILKKSGIPFTRMVQYPGDVMITFPGSYHFGFNTGFNIAEATNFAVPEWVPYGKLANVCLCRPDSVRIDMNRFERLLLQYEKEVKQTKRLTWRDWATRQRKKKKEQEEKSNNSPSKGKKDGAEGQQSKRKEFWVEVMQPITKKTAKQSKTTKSRKRPQKPQEVWHLAKPGSRNSLRPSTKVLCIMPAVIPVSLLNDDSSEEETEDEQCFAGVITEVRDDHVRVHFVGLSKKEDSWMTIESPKLFLDGGQWAEDIDEEGLPALHYWREEDSKRRCV